MAEPNNESTHIPLGDLNPISKPTILPTFDPSNTTATQTIRKVVEDRYSIDAFKNVAQFKGVVLRVDKDSPDAPQNWMNDLVGQQPQPLLLVKIRIPEIHAALRMPSKTGQTPGPHQKIIDLYPTFVAKNKDISKQIPSPGSLVWCDFLDRQNFAHPVYLGLVNPGGDAGAAGGNGKGQGGKESFDSAGGPNSPSTQGGIGGPGGGGGAGGRGGGGYTACNPGVSTPAKSEEKPADSKRPTLVDRASRVASRVGLPVRLLMAFIKVESNGKIATPNLVRFEPHLFLSTKARRKSWARPDLKGKIPYTLRDTRPQGQRVSNWFVSKIKSETNRRALDRAFALDKTAAIRSTSFGAFQVMGIHLLKLFSDPQKALEQYDKDPEGVGDAMIGSWMQENLRNGEFKKACTSCPPNFDYCTSVYNGPAQVKTYSPRLQEAYKNASTGDEEKDKVACTPADSAKSCEPPLPGTPGSGDPNYNPGHVKAPPVRSKEEDAVKYYERILASFNLEKSNKYMPKIMLPDNLSGKKFIEYNDPRVRRYKAANKNKSGGWSKGLKKVTYCNWYATDVVLAMGLPWDMVHKTFKPRGWTCPKLNADGMTAWLSKDGNTKTTPPPGSSMPQIAQETYTNRTGPSGNYPGHDWWRTRRKSSEYRTRGKTSPPPLARQPRRGPPQQNVGPGAKSLTGPDAGWTLVGKGVGDLPKAQEYANKGICTVVVGSGHIGLLRPNLSGDGEHYLAHAGRKTHFQSGREGTYSGRPGVYSGDTYSGGRLIDKFCGGFCGKRKNKVHFFCCLGANQANT